jgi:teichuronic acid biosynthesis glycosyltransferase TuaC
LNLLIIAGAGLFPTSGNPSGGVFFLNLLRQIQPHLQHLVVCHPQPVIPDPLARLAGLRLPSNARQHAYWEGIEVYRPRFPGIPANHQWLQSRFVCSAAWPVCRMLHRRHRFNLIIVIPLHAPTHAAQVAATRLGIPCLGWACGTDVHTLPRRSAESFRLFRHTVHRCNAVLAASDALRRMIGEMAGPASHVHTFYRGIDLAPLRNLPDRKRMRARLGLSAEAVYLASAGAVRRTKGAYEFYDAFVRLARTHESLAAVWIGDGPDARAIRRRAADDGLASRFTITGRVPRERVCRYLAAADVMAFASHNEGLPNVVMEALAAGLPTAATDVGGTREVLVDGVTGLLVPAKDAVALAAAVDRLLARPRWAAELAERGRRLILAHFDVARNAEIALSIFRQVAEVGGADAPLPACAGVPAGVLPESVVRNEA